MNTLTITKDLAERLSMSAHELLGNLTDAGQADDEDGHRFADVQELQNTIQELDTLLKGM